MPARAALLATLAVLGAGCGPPASARFEVSGVAEAYQDCFDVAFPFVPIFHAYRERADSVGLFFQSRGGNFQFVDVVYFEIFDPESVPTGTPIAVESITGPDTAVAAALQLQESCPVLGVLATYDRNRPALAEVPAIVGSVTFDQFSREIDGVIAGSIDGQLVDRRGEIAAESFTGEFEFTVQVGQPYEEFRN